MNDLETLGKTIQAHTEHSPRSEKVIREARERLRMSATERANRHVFSLPKWAWAGGGALACVALMLAAGGAQSLFFDSTARPADAPLSVTLESQVTTIVGTWVVAESETKQLSFSDGTYVSLHPHTKLRVVETTPAGGTIDLGKGRTLAQIEPLDGANWRFIAGPFSVRVTGTEFDLAWDPESGVLELALHQGSVMLSGPSVSGERPVRKGEFVRLEMPSSKSKEAPTEESTHRQTEPSRDPEDRAPSNDASREKAPGSRSKSESEEAPVQTGAASPDRGLLSPHPREVLAQVDKQGSDILFRSASAQELWSIARAARLGGRPELARDSLLALRNKHGTRGETSYLLGKVHADQLKATSEAISWFETYLKEAPGGPLAEQATGRLVELQAGTLRGRAAAKRYLQLYPSGSYADFSRSQLR